MPAGWVLVESFTLVRRDQPFLHVLCAQTKEGVGNVSEREMRDSSDICSTSYKDNNLVGWGPHAMISYNLNNLLKTLSPNALGSSIQPLNFEGT